MNGKQKNIILIAFLICLLPRVILTAINQTAGDDHIEPILLWLKNGVYPQASDCWECFQPPFYYGIVKMLSQIAGAQTENEIRIIYQWLNFIFSALTLVLVFIFQFKANLSFRFNLVLSLFWGLNPKLIAISIQATNDISVIFFGMCFLFFLLKWITFRKLFHLAAMFVCVFLAGIIKGNGLVLFFIFLAAIIYLFAFHKNEMRQNILLLVLGILIIPCIAVFGNYYRKYKTHNNPFLTNMPVAPAPAWFGETSEFTGRKGVTTVSESFFTFRFLSLISEPYNTNDLSEKYPAHRVSFFTQLYGQFSNAFFERSPPSWTIENPIAMNFVRANYLLQLPLLLLFIAGIFFSLKRLFISRNTSDFIHLASLLLYLVFTIRYAYTIRDFSTMKIIFLFPVLPSMLFVFQCGIEKLKNNFMQAAIFALISVSIILYVVNLAFFTGRLFALL